MNLEEAKEKASKCLGCSNPKCMEGCPIGINIPEFIKYIKEENLVEAYKVILDKSCFGAICGRVCSHDVQCKGNCVLGNNGEAVDIGALEAFVADWGLQNNGMIKKEKSPLNKERIAVVGGGVAGLTCASKLEKLGYAVTLFEKTSDLGGILQYGIPNDRLPKDIVYDTVDNITMARMEVEVGEELGKNFSIDDLFNRGYKAIFLAIGCDTAKKLDVPGDNKKGVYFAKDFLKRIDSIKFENIIVIGGGNVAMDVARTAKLRGAKNVNILYRRERKEMKANQIEIVKAIESGIKIIPNSVVTEVIGTENVTGVKCADGNIHRGDTVVIAIGSIPNLSILDGFKLTDSYLIEVDEFGETSRENVFAGGDLTCEHPNVSKAIKSALVAVEGIERKMKMYKQNL